MKYIFCCHIFGVLFLCVAARVQSSVCKFLLCGAVCGQNLDGALWAQCIKSVPATKDGTTVRYVQNLLTTYLEPYRTSVPYLSSIFEAYRTNVPYPYHCKKGVPYQRTVLSKNLGEWYCTYVPYRTPILALNYSQL